MGTVKQTIKSISENNEITIKFRNESDENLDYCWCDYEGVQQKYKTLHAHTSFNQTTMITHPWVIKKQNGNIPIAYFIPNSYLKNDLNYEVVSWPNFLTQMNIISDQIVSVFKHYNPFHVHEWVVY